MLIKSYLEGLSLVVEPHKGELTVCLDVQLPGGLFIRQYERVSCMPDRWVFQWLDSLDICMRICSPFALLFIEKCLYVQNSISSSLQSHPLSIAFSGLMWGHVLEDFSRYLPLWGCPTDSSPLMLPLLFFKEERYSSKAMLLWQNFKVDLHSWSITWFP